ncbi:MAG: hypothetical protein ETSY1_09240 [Candidatus Entotheonella factor]|uniref:Entry exclusion protein 1 n=1 Tax=Entotheonella factor TaxID=1429438 RepID=W4LU74_ENTF1|nr:MAG: hypothetical protein ETSY1_09240 [Candidatus Entotheonella factor]
MALVSISKAAKLAGISRQQLYDGYIHKGSITVNRDEPKRPKIDTAEIIRVFGTLQSDNQRPDNTLQDITPKKSVPYNGELNKTVRELTDKVRDLEREKAVLEALAEERKERLDTLAEQTESDRKEKERLLGILESQTRLLTAAQQEQEQPRRSWWPLWRKKTA